MSYREDECRRLDGVISDALNEKRTLQRLAGKTVGLGPRQFITAESGRGGDVLFKPGRGWVARTETVNMDGSFIFEAADGTEWLRLDPDGQARVRGEVVETNGETFAHFRDWLATARGFTAGNAVILQEGR